MNPYRVNISTNMPATNDEYDYSKYNIDYVSTISIPIGT